MQHSLSPKCPPLYIPLNHFDCLIKILQEEAALARKSRKTGTHFSHRSSKMYEGDDGSTLAVDDQGRLKQQVDYDQVGLVKQRTPFHPFPFPIVGNETDQICQQVTKNDSRLLQMNVIFLVDCL